MYVYIYNNLFPTKLGKGQKQTKKGETNKYWVYQFRMMELKNCEISKEEQ